MDILGEKMNKTAPTESLAVNIFTEHSEIYTEISPNIYLFPFLHKEFSKIPTDMTCMTWDSNLSPIKVSPEMNLLLNK